MKRILTVTGSLALTPLLRREWKAQEDSRKNERPVEYAFALECLAAGYPDRVLDVGTGTTAWPRVLADCGFHVTAIDQVGSYWAGGFVNRHFHVQNDDITRPTLVDRFDFITCISVLEHIAEHEGAVRGMFDLLRPGGHVVITCPYNEHRYVEDVYRLPGAGYGRNATYICRVSSRREVEAWLRCSSASIIRQEYYEAFTGELWTFGNRLEPPRRTSREGRHHLTCLLLRKPPGEAR